MHNTLNSELHKANKKGCFLQNILFFFMSIIFIKSALLEVFVTVLKEMHFSILMQKFDIVVQLRVE